ncbi:fructose-1,6-bisphosphatase/inositol monophosphatase family enzyme [Sphingomonas vulcanisoli]|uniref:Fructose-1,6-bisphosphatase/inositol monophosphatase family enzyme n=1 Tax=Sphingomonas vulcanisoli TaxID=1658060 RepID=A0ABX0TUX8_9SPHN|nr:inositol monophosphatase family protein [Sphingomonas vulcanisoli]NIJ08145.1 fructose-1,6-bisphosphatase/inositol monophosphatase family enzyme [Sphingomonas vulcanisoli]
MPVHPLDAPVTALMRAVARDIVLPHFRTLGAEQVMEKGPGDLVTVADRLSEERLTEGLLTLLPEARVIGEEAVAADPSLLDGIDQGLAWIVDPIDGTANYAEGVQPFAIMIALVADGETQAGWILDPVRDRLCHAHLGHGAYIDGERTVAQPGSTVLPTIALTKFYLPAEMRAAIADRLPGKLIETAVPRCAGEQYPRIVTGESDIALFWRSLPWDHAPGALFLTEAGGRIARFDGRPYRVGGEGNGLIAAASPQLWDQAREILIG